MNSRIVNISIVLILLLGVGFGFQNCTKVDFDNDTHKADASSVTLDSTPSDPGAEISEVTMTDSDPNNNPEDVCLNSSCNNSLIDTKTVTSKGRLVQIAGTCKSAAGNLLFSEDILKITDLSAKCENGKFKHCALLANHFELNKIRVKQVQDEVQFNVMLNTPPAIRLSIDNITITGTKAIVSGKCNKTSALEFTIYNKKQNTSPVYCDADGFYEFKNVTLIANLAGTGQRVLTVRQVSSTVNTSSISYDVDAVSAVPKCEFKQFIPSAKICSGEAGRLLGTCHPGLPVYIHVNGFHQNTTLCNAQGTFSVEDVLFNDKSGSNKLEIKQATPYGQSCNYSNTEVFQ